MRAGASKLTAWFSHHPLAVGLALILVSRLLDLDFNGPSKEEAVYITIGRLGLIWGDWQAYTPQNWLPAVYFLYPSLAALASFANGIWGARLLSSLIFVWGLVGFYRLSYTILLTRAKHVSQAAMLALLAVFLLGFSQPAWFLSRIASYEIVGWASVVWGLSLAVQLVTSVRLSPADKHRLHFFVHLLWILSIMFKLNNLFYVIPLEIWFIIMAYRQDQLSGWKKYALPQILLAALLLWYSQTSKGLLFYLQSAPVFTQQFDSQQLFRDWLQLDHALLLTWLWASLAMVNQASRRIRLIWLGFSLAGFGFLLFQLLLPASGKVEYLFYWANFIALASVWSLANLVISKTKIKQTVLVIIGLWLAIYVGYTTQQRNLLNQYWPDTSQLHLQLKQMITGNEHILSEAGPVTMYYLYPKLPPQQITTFDWFFYRNQYQPQAIYYGVEDGYFDWILLYPDQHPRTASYQAVQAQLADLIRQNYQMILVDKNLTAYQRKF